MSLDLFVDGLNIFSALGPATVVEIRYPGPDMELVLKYDVEPPFNCCVNYLPFIFHFWLDFFMI